MTTTTLRQRLADYIEVRRGLGFKLEDYPWILGDFVSYLEAAGASAVTTELAVAWATQLGVEAHPAYLAKRLSVVRGFARHLAAFDPSTEIPSVDLLPNQACRATPYLYSQADVAALIGAARALTPRLRAATYEALIGLLVVTGGRIGELIRLDRDDVDWDEGALAITYTKFNKHRELALHPSTVQALKAYADERDEVWANPKGPSFFVSTKGTRLVHVTVQQAFARLARGAGLRPRSAQCRPRIHDIRH
jgi:integrase/recombinase XerD